MSLSPRGNDHNSLSPIDDTETDLIEEWMLHLHEEYKDFVEKILSDLKNILQSRDYLSELAGPGFPQYFNDILLFMIDLYSIAYRLAF